MSDYEFRYVMDGKKRVKQYRSIDVIFSALTGEKRVYGIWVSVKDEEKDISENKYRCPDTMDMFPNDGEVK